MGYLQLVAKTYVLACRLVVVGLLVEYMKLILWDKIGTLCMHVICASKVVILNSVYQKFFLSVYI